MVQKINMEFLPLKYEIRAKNSLRFIAFCPISHTGAYLGVRNMIFPDYLTGILYN